MINQERINQSTFILLKITIDEDEINHSNISDKSQHMLSAVVPRGEGACGNNGKHTGQHAIRVGR